MLRAMPREGGPVLNSWRKNSYFHFHPMHNLYSLVMALILFGMISAVPGDAGAIGGVRAFQPL